MPIKVTNPRISVDLIRELETEAAYSDPKAFIPTHAFLRRVIHFCRNQEYAQIAAKYIKEQFKNFSLNYKPCLDALERRGIIELDRHYIVGAKTRGYRLTQKGLRLMTAGELVYLQSLSSDPILKRQLQKQASYHRNHNQKYKDKFLQYLSAGLLRYEFVQQAIPAIQQSKWSALTKTDALMTLADFTQRKFTKLKFNEADARVWNEFVGMKSDLRRYFKLGNLSYRYVMDIRSCHPLFLGHYLVNRARERGYEVVNPMMPGKHQHTIVENDGRERERSVRSSFPNSTYSNPTYSPTTTSTIPNNPNSNNQLPHYDGGNSDIQSELGRWNTLFGDPNTDPKAVLIRELGYTREQAKSALNHSINGSNQYRKFVSWFKRRFPLLHQVWERTRRAKVGNEISAFYETSLMQDMELYRLAERLGLHLTYEYDGCGVMCREDDAEVLTKIAQLVQHVQARSERLWGIRPVLTVKTAAGEQVTLPERVVGGQVRSAASQRPGTGRTQRPDAKLRRSPRRAIPPNRRSGK